MAVRPEIKTEIQNRLADRDGDTERECDEQAAQSTVAMQETLDRFARPETPAAPIGFYADIDRGIASLKAPNASWQIGSRTRSEGRLKPATIERARFWSQCTGSETVR